MALNIKLITIDGKKIKINREKVVLRHYHSVSENSSYVDEILYFDPDYVDFWKTDYVDKHKLLDIVSRESVDTSDIDWMEGIELRTTKWNDEIYQIYSYGSKEAYEASLPTATDQMLMELNHRLALMELGLA